VLDTDHLRRITTELQTLAEAGVDGLDPETLCEVALAARRAHELVDHIQVHALGALEPTGHTEATTGMNAGAWFARQAGLPSAVGRTQIATARALRRLPDTDQAWLDGRISREHVRVFIATANPRIRDHIATLQPHLIRNATELTFYHWRLRMSEVEAQLDTEGRDPDDPNHSTASWGRVGLFADLKAKFAGADVELLEQIIEARTNALHRTNLHEHEQTSDLPLLSRSQLRALAIIDLILHGHHTADETNETDEHTHGHDEHDEHGHDVNGIDDELGHEASDLDEDQSEPGSDSASDTAGDSDDQGPGDPTLFDAIEATKNTKKNRKRLRTRNPLRVGIDLVLHADGARAPNPDLTQLLDPGPDPGPTWRLTNPDGRDLPIDRVASLICDADIQALLVDDADNPLNHGRTKRFATPEQRRAVIIRDGGCNMPGCDCPVAWVEIHHVKLWTKDGGTTDIIILAALCRRHHGITHRKGWSMHATDDGWFYWITPSGDSFWSQRHGRQRTGPTPHQLGIAA
jgi:hypothetical protein